METDCRYISYHSTHSFSKLALDYLDADQKLQPFYEYQVTLQGIESAIADRKGLNYDRSLLVEELQRHYASSVLSVKQLHHIENLLQPNTFTITTAHQPNIFTGHLYFIYKILHAIKLADELKQSLPENNFVPVYYMGSEDADLDELGHIYLDGEKVEWGTQQTGAVGRMHTKGLDKIIDRLQGEFGDLPFGTEMVELCTKAYKQHTTIQQATFYLVNELFKEYGLLIVIPDNASLKKTFEPVVKKELLEQFSHKLVAQTIDEIGEHYKVQAGGRDINLFYLNDEGRRERIELRETRMEARSHKFEVRPKTFEVRNLGLVFTEKEILQELDEHPERFSANVILRGVFQETILPNIAFIGGGGELAYWLELKSVFEAVKVPYPVLVLRNSFLMKNENAKQLQQKLGLSNEELFLKEQDTMNLITERNTSNRLNTETEQQQAYKLYEQLQVLASSIDVTLKPHVAALHTRTLQGLQGLEKKMLRAERRKQTEKLVQLQKLRALLFPRNNLQERVDNFMPLYAKYGKALIDVLYSHSLTLEQQFGIVEME